MRNIFDIIFWIIYLFQVPTLLHIMQQESYQNDGMFRWIVKNPGKAFKRGFVDFIIVLITYLITLIVITLLANNNIIDPTRTQSILKVPIFYVPMFTSFIAFLITNIMRFIKEHKERKEAKKPLKYTARAKRLIFFNFIALVLIQVFFLQSFNVFYPKEIQADLNYNNYVQAYIQSSGDKLAIEQVNQRFAEAQAYDDKMQLIYSPILYAFLVFTLPVNIIIANFLASPTETFVNNYYINKARRKLRSKDYKNLIKIGITGSYGKTSTKFILKTILSEKYNVLATPGSYNTTMGNVRVIREQLKPEHEVLISEMGARKRFDIQEICDFVRPDIGIITSIGEQHLDTFKNIKNIQKTKGELLYGVPYDGAIFLPADNQYCKELYDKDSHENKFLFSLNDKNTSVYAKDVKVSKEGSTFTVVSKMLGEYTVKTRLLGMHNVENILGAILIAEYLDLTKEQIIVGVSKVEPVEHRLQLLPTTNGTTVIDDAFNSNPIGSKMALDVIKQFEGRKIIITPGMVELGEKEKELNKEFGKQMASAVDIAILVGIARSKPIEDGLIEAGFNDDNIYIVKSLDEATSKLGSILTAGDVVLFENDLPDSYTE